MIKIVTMNESHVAQVAQVAALEALCFSDPWSEKSVASDHLCYFTRKYRGIDRENGAHLLRAEYYVVFSRLNSDGIGLKNSLINNLRCKRLHIKISAVVKLSNIV